MDYRERSQLWLHSALGYVLQTPHLFSGSIADNIRYGRKDATLDEVKRAAAMVRADRFIEALPDGYGTEVGEGGGRFPQGKSSLCASPAWSSPTRAFSFWTRLPAASTPRRNSSSRTPSRRC